MKYTIYPSAAFISIAICISIAAAQTGKQAAAPNDSDEAPKHVEVKAGKAVIPMTLFVKKPVVDVMINGKGPFKFFLDTGAGGTVLDQELADELKLPVSGTVRIGDPTDPQGIEAKRDHIDKLEIGGAVLSDLIAVSFDRSTLYQAGAPRGVLGIPLFQKLVLTIDYPGGEIVIAKGKLPNANGKNIVDIKPSNGGIFAVPLTVGSKALMATIDTGSQSRLSFPPEFMGTLALDGKPVEVGRGRTVGGEAVIYGAKLKDAVRLGGYSFDALDVTFFGRLKLPNLGYGFLSQFAISIDQQNLRMRFERPPVKTVAEAISQGKSATDEHAGVFGERRVIAENGELFLQRQSGPMGEGPKLRLNEVSKDAYAIEGMKNDVRVKFVRSASGEITEIQVLGPSGGWETAKRQ